MSAIRAALWTVRALRAARRQLGGGRDPRALDLPPVPDLPASAVRGMGAVLRRTRSSCLVQASIRQRWHAAHGDRRDLVIGVRPPAEGFGAHAWLDGDPESRDGAYSELTRVPAA